MIKTLKTWVAVACVLCLVAGAAMAAEKQGKKLPCCQQAAAADKECKHKCSIAAHKEGKSCEKCNPNKEDLKLKKADPKADK